MILDNFLEMTIVHECTDYKNMSVDLKLVHTKHDHRKLARGPETVVL